MEDDETIEISNHGDILLIHSQDGEEFILLEIVIDFLLNQE